MCKGGSGLPEARLALQHLAALVRHAQSGAAQWERQLGDRRLAVCAAQLGAAADLLDSAAVSLTSGEQPPAGAYSLTRVGASARAR